MNVGSVRYDQTKSSFSNWGSCITLFAPGSAIKSAGHTGDSEYKTLSGTSMAAPFVTGALALVREASKTLTAKQAQNWVKTAAISGRVHALDMVRLYGITTHHAIDSAWNCILEKSQLPN